MSNIKTITITEDVGITIDSQTTFGFVSGGLGELTFSAIACGRPIPEEMPFRDGSGCFITLKVWHGPNLVTWVEDDDWEVVPGTDDQDATFEVIRQLDHLFTSAFHRLGDAASVTAITD